MRTPRVFVDGAVRPGDLVELAPGEALHLAGVLRRRVGDRVEIIGTSGLLLEAEVTTVRERDSHLEVQVQVLGPAPLQPPRLLPWTLGLALVKGDAWELSIRMASELGFERLAPVLAERCISRPTDAAGKLKRWTKLAQEAAKQCGRGSPLAIAPWQSLEALVRACVTPRKFITVPLGPSPLERLLGRQAAPGAATILVGPEGGFTPSEVATARGAGFEVLGLPTPVLRTPTAVALLGALGVFAVDLPGSFS